MDDNNGFDVTQKPRRIDLSPDNFIAGVAGQMTAEQLGVYWLICLLIYSHGGPIEYDESRFAALLPGTHWRTIRAASQRLQKLDKITLSGPHVMAKGCSEPLQAAIMRVSKAAENGGKGGRPRNETKEIEKPEAFHHEKLTRVTPPSPPSPPSPSSLRSDAETTPKASHSKPKKALPENFPEERDLKWAQDRWLQKGRTDLCNSMGDEVQKFRDYQTSHDTKSADWSASWRTWAQNALNFSKANRNENGTYDNGRRGKPAVNSFASSVSEAVAERAAERVQGRDGTQTCGTSAGPISEADRRAAIEVEPVLV